MRTDNMNLMVTKNVINAPDQRETGEGISGTTHEPERDFEQPLCESEGCTPENNEPDK